MIILILMIIMIMIVIRGMEEIKDKQSRKDGNRERKKEEHSVRLGRTINNRRGYLPAFTEPRTDTYTYKHIHTRLNT